jgi:hypothetical protein
MDQRPWATKFRVAEFAALPNDAPLDTLQTRPYIHFYSLKESLHP